MATAHCTALHNHTELLIHMRYCGVGNGSAATGQSKSSRTLNYMGLVTVNNPYKQQRRGHSLCCKWLTATRSKGSGVCPNTRRCSTCIIHNYSDIMHHRRFLLKRRDHVTHKIPNHFTDLVFLNWNFCGDKKRVLCEKMFPDYVVLKFKNWSKMKRLPWNQTLMKCV